MANIFGGGGTRPLLEFARNLNGDPPPPDNMFRPKPMPVAMPQPAPDTRTPYQVQPVDLGQDLSRTGMTLMPLPGAGMNDVITDETTQPRRRALK
jgi:hypothetical protein